MKAGFVVSAVLLTGLAGCATDHVAQSQPAEPGPQYRNREVQTWKGPGMLGDLRWEWDASGKKKEQTAAPAAAAAASPAPATAAEQEEFKKWQESAGRSERQEFEDWRAWREWKKQNPK